MKFVDPEDIDRVPGRRLGDGDTFHFRCHAGLACFNRCCRNLNLFLYPYDVLRLKTRLAISSDRFLEQYVDVVMRPGAHFPEVLLRMSEGGEKTCPFLTEAGCSVYPDRPDTCRTFPVELGSLWDPRRGKPRLVRFFRPPDFCLGRHENRPMTPRSWADDQDAVVYNRMTFHWAELRRLFQGADPWGREGPEGPRAKMAFMATYNIDRFRAFVFQSTFMKRYRLKAALVKKMEHDDAELLTFGFEWVRWFVWGLPGKRIRMRR